MIVRNRGFGQMDTSFVPINTSAVPVSSGPLPYATYEAALDALPIYTPGTPLTVTPATPSDSISTTNWALIAAAGLGLVLFVPLLASGRR
jgi:hypothetical protein